jgi:hypothetical protein
MTLIDIFVNASRSVHEASPVLWYFFMFMFFVYIPIIAVLIGRKFHRGLKSDDPKDVTGTKQQMAAMVFGALIAVVMMWSMNG